MPVNNSCESFIFIYLGQGLMTHIQGLQEGQGHIHQIEKVGKTDQRKESKS